MLGEFFCNVCSHWFKAEVDADEAICLGCGENILPEPAEYNYVDKYDALNG